MVSKNPPNADALHVPHNRSHNYDLNSSVPGLNLSIDDDDEFEMFPAPLLFCHCGCCP